MLNTDLNLNHLRVFSWVYQKRSMTEAANELHQTQSGVSQHIKNLEDLLGVKLFDRLHRKLIPCPEADQLYEQCQKSFKDLEYAIMNIRPHDNKDLRGTIRIGLPEEFGTNVILPLIGVFGGEHPNTRFDIKFGLAAEICAQLIDGELDLALVDHFQVDSRVALRQVYSETLHLCINPELLRQLGTFRNKLEYYENLPFIAYQPGEPVIRMWFAHHFERRKTKIRSRATAVNVQGVAQLILAGLGAGVIPNHLIERLKSQNHELHVYKGSSKPLENTISLATLQDRTLSPTHQEFYKFLCDRLE